MPVDSLLLWLGSASGSRAPLSIEDIRDATIMAKTMARIAPTFFEETLPMYTRAEKDDWRTQLSNLKRLHRGMKAYCEDGLQLDTSALDHPDFAMATQHKGDVAVLDTHVERLVGLVLCCAVHCENRQEYVSAILSLDEQVQAVMMGIIQPMMALVTPVSKESDHSPPSRGEHTPRDDTHTDDVGQVIADLKDQNMRLAIQLEAAERDQSELQSRVNLAEASPSSMATPAGKAKANALKMELERVKEDMDSLEIENAQLREAGVQAGKDMDALVRKCDGMTEEVEVARGLKDELEVLKHAGNKVSKLTQQLEVYKRKLEEVGDVRRQVARLEEENRAQVDKNLDLSDELRGYKGLRQHLERFKEQVGSLETKNREAALALQKKTLECESMAHKIKTLESNLEQSSVAALEVDASGGGAATARHRPSLSNALNDDMKLKVERIEAENRQLRAQSGEESGEAPAYVHEMLADKERARQLLEQDYLLAVERADTLEKELETMRSAQASNLAKSLEHGEHELVVKELAQSEIELGKERKAALLLRGRTQEVEAELAAVMQVLTTSQQENVDLKKKTSMMSMDKEQMIAAMREDFDQELSRRNDEGEKSIVEARELKVMLETTQEENRRRKEESTQYMQQVNTLLSEKDAIRTKFDMQQEQIHKQELLAAGLDKDSALLGAEAKGKLAEAKERLLVLHDEKKHLSTALTDERSAHQAFRKKAQHAFEEFKGAKETILSLQRQLVEMDDVKETAKTKLKEQKDRHTQEQRLVVSAWYDMGMRLQRREASVRLGRQDGGSSWLAKQRASVGGSRRNMGSTDI